MKMEVVLSGGDVYKGKRRPRRWSRQRMMTSGRCSVGDTTHVCSLFSSNKKSSSTGATLDHRQDEQRK